jgi:hypothetical protein
MRTAILAILFMGMASRATAAEPILTPFGLGPLKIGMREAEAAKRLGLRIAPDGDVDSLICREDSYQPYPDISVMAERGIVTRIVIAAPSRLRTDRGLGIGSTEADVRRVYGHHLKIETAAYEDEPAHDLTFWVVRSKHRWRGIRYGTDEHGRVRVIYAGSKSIRYIESCL